MKIVITGGHHSSALPVIAELKKRFPDIKIYWFGHKHSLKGDKNTTLEFRDISQLGIPFIDLKAGKVYRTLDPIRLIKVPFGFFQAFYELVKIKPDLVLSFGGYLAVPVVLAAWILRIPSLTHEQTMVTGYANKFISIFVDKIMISWKESEKYFPKEKVVYTGIPLRAEIFTSSSNNFKLNSDIPTIYVTAGKTGSHRLNEIIEETMINLLDKFNVIHQCGDNSVYKDYERLSYKFSHLKVQTRGNYHLRKFIMSDEIGEAYQKADVVVCRAGAHTISELAALNKNALIIPIPWVSHNEQFINAKYLEEQGSALVLDEKDLSSKHFLEKLEQVINLPRQSSKTNSVNSNVNEPIVKIAHEISKLLR